MQDLFWIAPVGSSVALIFAALLVVRIIKAPRGTPAIRLIQEAIAEGANAYLRRQYAVVSIFFLSVFVLFLFMARAGLMPIFVPFAFLTGGFFSGLSGFIGMQVAIRANGRTTFGATQSLNRGLRIAFSSGAVMGFVVVGLGLLDLSIWYYLLNWFYRDQETALRIQNITSTMLSFGMGASSQALFARVGGGIFTKAADVGADLVGKVEAGIPEDDARNPATIADNVGDNVGDVAGMGADLYESYVGSMVATMVLAVAAGLGMAGVTVPMIMAAVGILASIVGTFFVQTHEKASQEALLAAIRRGIMIAAALVAVISYFAVTYVLGAEHRGIYFAILAGLVAGVVIGFSTEFFTSDCYLPTKSIAKSSLTGAATVIISGFGVGMLSTAVPVLAVAAAIWVAFWASGGMQNYSLGLYGVGISAVGMLSTLGITLATDSYGPVADNAGGIAQTSGQEPVVRRRTDALDALGNTTAATGKGFAIGSAALTALALIVAYRADVGHLTGREVDASLLNPRLIAGMFVGAMLPFLFCALTINAVGNAAQAIVLEVRRQFKEIQGLMEGKARAEYGKCVAICARAAQREMILPAATALASPILVGLVFNVEGVLGLLTGGLVAGFLLAVFMANAGGAWDNAKKHVEAGNYGGKGSPQHKATVVGDTVGDPLKDTSGPSINILIKLMSMVSVVFAGFIIRYALFQ
jgi:K(+)-stimulated pyrophosphate-energized sodium pump